MSPAKSKKQQQAAGIALSAKRGKTPKSKLRGASKQMSKMSEKQLKDYASKPDHAEENMMERQKMGGGMMMSDKEHKKMMKKKHK